MSGTGWELMSFTMFPERLVGDARMFIEKDVCEVLNRAGIQVVDGKFKGVEGVPPSEFILDAFPPFFFDYSINVHLLVDLAL